MNRFRTVLFVVAGVMLAGLLLWLLRPSGAQPDSVTDDRPAASFAPGVLQAAPAVPQDAVATVERSVAPAVAVEPDAGAAKLDMSRLVFRGRCVAAETGQPLSGCTVTFFGWPGNDELIALHGEPDWKDPDPIVTGNDGVFSFDVPETLSYQFAIDCAAPGRLTRSDRYDTEIPGGTQHELGDVPMPLGAKITGVVRDESGDPVADAAITVLELPMEIRRGTGAGNSAVGLSDDHGRFQFSDGIPAGTWKFWVNATGYTLVGKDSITVDPNLAPVHLQLRVQAQRWIEGIVVDDAGQPVANAYVDGHDDADGWFGGVWTNSKGAFRIYGNHDAGGPVHLTVTDAGLEPTTTEESYPWGSSGVRVQARRLLRTEILVREKGTGVPVEVYAVKCQPPEANSSDQTDARLGGSHPGGRLVVTEVAIGENLIQILPRDPDLQPNAPLLFVAPREEAEPLVIELERLSPLWVQVVTAAGVAVAGSQVGLLSARPEEDDDLDSLDVRQGYRDLANFRSPELPVLWSRDETDKSGEAQLLAPSAVATLIVAVEGKHPRLLVEIERPFAQPAPIKVVLPGATVRGRLLHPHAGKGSVGLNFVQEGRFSSGGEPVLPDANGHFEAAGLEPGSYSIHLSLQNEYGSSGFSISGWEDLEPALAQIALADGETRILELDAMGLTFGSLDAGVQISDPGATDIEASLLLEHLGTLNGERRFGRFAVGVSGRFNVNDLPPGRYYAEAQWQSLDGSMRSLRSLEHYDLRTGEAATTTFRFSPRRLRLRVLDSQGAPLAGVTLRRPHANSRERSVITTDPEGWVELDWMSPGEEMFFIKDRSHFFVRVEADQETTVAEVRTLTQKEEAAKQESAQDGG